MPCRGTHGAYMAIMKMISPVATAVTALSLARGLGITKLRTTTNVNVTDMKLINWGLSTVHHIPGSDYAEYINHPVAVANAVDKIKTFEILGKEFTVDWTTNPAEAYEWCMASNTVIARTTTTGRGGKGIEVYNPYVVHADEEIPYGDGVPTHPRNLFNSEYKLFTKYFNGRYEFRVHVAVNKGGEYKAFDIQRKGATDNSQSIIRNSDSGYTFVRGEVFPSQVDNEVQNKLKALSCLSVKMLGLHFGAVDVRVSTGGVIRILEVNTAPGLSGTTLENYINFFSNNYKD